MMQVKDVPNELLNIIRNQFEANTRIREMRAQQQLLFKGGKIQPALQIGEKIEQLFVQVVNTYIQETERDVERLDLNTVPMPAKDRQEIMILMLTAFMACDIIETAVVEINDVIQRSDNTLEMDQFNELIKLSKYARTKLEYLSKNSKYMDSMFWGEKCDDMFTMLKNKAGSIFRKHNSKGKQGK